MWSSPVRLGDKLAGLPNEECLGFSQCHALCQDGRLRGSVWVHVVAYPSSSKRTGVFTHALWWRTLVYVRDCVQHGHQLLFHSQ